MIRSFIVPGSPLLLIFAGRGQGVGPGVPVAEFVRSTEALGCSRIFLADASRRWYQGGIDVVRDSVDRTADWLSDRIRAARPPRVMALGNCMGGYAAILFGQRLNVDEVLAMAPQTFISPALREEHGDARWPEDMERAHAAGSSLDWDVLPLLADGLTATRYRIRYSPRVGLDQVHAERLRGLPGVEVEQVPTTPARPGVARWLRDEGLLEVYLREGLGVRT